MGSSSNNLYSEELGQKQCLLRKILSYPLYALLPIILIHFYFNPFSFSPPIHDFPSSNRIIISSPTTSQEDHKKSITHEPPCDYTKGQWVRTKQEPLYNGTTCNTIKPGQNCMVSGRPDRDYLHWRWQPRHCHLPQFAPKTFLHLLRNKHIAFVGDSLARNQLESLLCMLATAARPVLYYAAGEESRFRKWHFPDHKVNVSVYWSPFLVKGVEKTTENNFNTVFLDTVNEAWAGDLEGFDAVVLSAGQWYLLPAVYYYDGVELGCHYKENCTEIGFYDAYGRALETALEAVVRRKGVTVFVTTFPPAHFDGEWDKLGACPKTTPYEEGEREVEGMNEEMRRIGVEKVRAAAAAEAAGEGVRVEALDITKLAMMRPDGHPGPYMLPFPFANGVPERVPNDCVHWCLPGPIDTWNEILLEYLIKIMKK